MALGDKLPTYSLYVKSATLLTSQSTCMAIGLEESTTMEAVYTSTTNVFVDECTGNGLSRLSATTVELSTVTIADDACRVSVQFTAATSATIAGHCVCSTASTATYDIYSFYTYAAAIPIESGDTLTCTNDHQFKIG